jgi:hypothetical protein
MGILTALSIAAQSLKNTATVFNSKGTEDKLTFLFAKTGATTYRYRVVANSAEITGGTSGNLYQVAPERFWSFNASDALDAGAKQPNDSHLI